MLDIFIEYIKIIVEEYGFFGVFYATLIEEVIAPIPSSLVPMLAGFSFLGTEAAFLSLFYSAVFIIAFPVAVGVSLGSLLVYFIGYFGGRPLIEKSKKFLGLSWESVEKIEKKMTAGHKDEVALFILRMIPVIPGVAISAFCGLVRYKLKTFIIITFLGSFFRAFLLGFLGFYVGDLYFKYSDYISSFEKYIFIVIVVIFIIIFLKRKFMRSEKRVL